MSSKTMNSKIIRESIANYCRKRNAAVIAAVRDGNVEPLKRLAEKSDQPVPNDYVLLISAHKMCLAITTMPEDLQAKSRRWLKERGFDEVIR